VIHHSDQGSQYTSLAFGQRCEQAGARPSRGSVGDGFDNAMCESFFATLECELLERRRFKPQVEARMAVFDFSEGWYNPHRRHSALGYLSPVEYERIHRDQAEQNMRSATALRTAGPPPAAASGAVQGAAVADPEPLSFSASASHRVKAEAEKLVSDHGQEDTCSNAKPMN
jgi:Integrase core domain